MKIIDLFAGVGGLSLGFKWAGYKTHIAIDFWEDAVRTYNHNDSEKSCLHVDIHEFNDNILKPSIKDVKIDGVIGGPPCQGFSTVGTRDVNDKRNHLYKEFFRTVKIVNPKFFVIENVKGLLTLNNGHFVEEIVNSFSDLGYTVSYKLINASDYGIPQNRHRVFFVGIKDKEFMFPNAKDKVVSSSEAIEDLSHANGKYNSKPSSEFQQLMRNGNEIVHNHEITIHTEQTQNVISMVPDGGNIKSLPPEYWNIRRYNKAFQRMASNKPSNTIDTGHRNYFHYRENRIPTVRESARIQSFPDDFVFLGNKGSQYKQVGNAVPPLLAKEIANAIKRQIY